MPEVRVDVSKLKVEGEDLVEELADFLKEKAEADVRRATDEVVVRGEDVSKRYLRVLLRKFLYKVELKDYYRVISGKENTLIIKGKKVLEEG